MTLKYYIVIWIREQSLNMRLDWEEMLASPPGLMMIPESGYPRFSDPSKSVLWRSSLGSHLERFPVTYYPMNPDAAPFYPNCNSVTQSSSLHLHSIHPRTLLSPAYFEEPSISMSEIHEEPATRDSGAPAATLHSVDPPLLVVPVVRHMDGGDLQQLFPEHGEYESPCPDLDEDESPAVTDETSLSSKDEYEPFYHPLQSMESVCDLTRSLDLDRIRLRNSIAQRDGLRADLLQHVKSILDTLDDDLYLLYQARYHLDDLIKGFTESRPRDQTSSAL